MHQENPRLMRTLLARTMNECLGMPSQQWSRELGMVDHTHCGRWETRADSAGVALKDTPSIPYRYRVDYMDCIATRQWNTWW